MTIRIRILCIRISVCIRIYIQVGGFFLSGLGDSGINGRFISGGGRDTLRFCRAEFVLRGWEREVEGGRG